jgi:hypothetical protein
MKKKMNCESAVALVIQPRFQRFFLLPQFFFLFCYFQQMAKRVDVPQSKELFRRLKIIAKRIIVCEVHGLSHRVVIYKSNNESSPD